MKKLIKKLEDIMVAITFAEAGEYDQAQSENRMQEDTAKPSGGFKQAVTEHARK